MIRHLRVPTARQSAFRYLAELGHILAIFADLPADWRPGDSHETMSIVVSCWRKDAARLADQVRELGGEDVSCSDDVGLIRSVRAIQRGVAVANTSLQTMSAASDREEPSIRQMLELSTAHLPPGLQESLSSEPGVDAWQWAYGWVMWVPSEPDMSAAEDPDGPPPTEILAILRYARTLGCDYVLLDREGGVNADLPTWDED